MSSNLRWVTSTLCVMEEIEGVFSQFLIFTYCNWPDFHACSTMHPDGASTEDSNSAPHTQLGSEPPNHPPNSVASAILLIALGEGFVDLKIGECFSFVSVGPFFTVLYVACGACASPCHCRMEGLLLTLHRKVLLLTFSVL